ncbi:acyl-CoA carboxylase subunit epsilon [Streptomyces sp. NPDC048172]|uniref:acyl-CoA carboxylase subunit epsilon n=1 Tax=Streptomyces sp. NPDC048172 TaxID=3365505 RepID=UPI003718DA8F
MATPTIRVVRGNPDTEELVALTTVLHALSRSGAELPAVRQEFAAWARARLTDHRPATSWRAEG